jgi:hypothetical protein
VVGHDRMRHDESLGHNDVEVEEKVSLVKCRLWFSVGTTVVVAAVVVVVVDILVATAVVVGFHVTNKVV